MPVVLYWVLLFIAVVVAIGGLAFLGRPPRYKVNSLNDFQRHVAYMGRALAGDGLANLHIQGIDGPIAVRKTVFKTKEATLTLRTTTGHQGRTTVRKMAEALGKEGIDHKPRFTKKRNWLRDFRLVWSAEDPLTPSAMSHVLTVCASAVQVDFRGICSIVYWGPLDLGYWPREEDPVGAPKSYRLGYAVGKSSGRLLRWLLGKDRA